LRVTVDTPIEEEIGEAFLALKEKRKSGYERKRARKKKEKY